MMLRAVVIWVVGLLTLVPAAAWYLLFHAEREQYAILITFVLFWPFGYWGVVGPLIGAIKARRVFRALEQAQAQGQLREALQSKESEDVVIDLIAEDNHLPRFLAAWIVRLIKRRMIALHRREQSQTPDPPPAP